MNHASLFSGIGGFDLAAQWMGWNNVFQVEWDKYCQKVLTKNFPNVKRYQDIKDFNGTEYWGVVDIISGGFPCQPFSSAGKRKGTADDRYLWPEMLRVIREVKPSYVVGENVAGLVSMENGSTLDSILADLEDEGYSIESFIIPACSVGAWHRRDRIWIIGINRITTGNSRNDGHQGKSIKEEVPEKRFNGSLQNIANSKCNLLRQKRKGRLEMEQNSLDHKGREKDSNGSSKICESSIKNQWEIEPSVGRVANGIPRRVDRLKGLGNAIVPQVAYEIFKAIENDD